MLKMVRKYNQLRSLDAVFYVKICLRMVKKRGF